MQFPTTHWSSLAQASLSGQPTAAEALERFCQRYRQPICGFIRSRLRDDHQAEDLTHEFILHLLEKSTLQRADRHRGKFRSFLLGALTRFLGDQTDRRQARKRGGHIQHFSLDAVAEAHPDATPAVGADDVVRFDREWALRILEFALDRIRREQAESAAGLAAFEVLKDFLPGGAAPLSYDEAAARLGLSLPALKSEIHRLRRRLRSLVRDEVAQTVSAPHEIEEEMLHLQQVLMDRGHDWKPERNPET